MCRKKKVNQNMTEKKVLTDKKRTGIFVNIVVSCIATSMLATALTTALPAIVGDFHINVATGQWLTSGYSLAMGITMPLTAFLITRFPTRKLYFAGLIISIAGLIFCAIAPNFQLMMAARVLQAIGNGILSAMAQVIILTIYPLEKRGSAMGWYGLSVGAAPVVAPTLAGIIVDSLGWRSIFYLSMVIVLIALICAWFVFDDVLDTTKKKFDTPSFAISIFAFGGITLGIGNMGNYPFVSPHVLFSLLIGLIAAILFVYRQLHMNSPFLELRVLKNRNYTLSVVGSMLLYFVMMGSSIIMPLYVQIILGHSATFSGLVVLPGSLAMTIISPFAGKIYDRIGIKPLFICGAAAMFISNFSLFFITMNTSVWVACICNIIRCVAIGCLMMPFVTWGISSTKNNLMAHGTALLTSLRTITGAMGTAVFVGIMNFVAVNSSDKIGSNALLHGLNVTFLCMSMVSLTLLLLGVFGIKKARNRIAN